MTSKAADYSVSQLLSVASPIVLIVSECLGVCIISTVAALIPLAVMQSGLYMHDYCIDGKAHAWYFLTVCFMVVSRLPICDE